MTKTYFSIYLLSFLKLRVNCKSCTDCFVFNFYRWYLTSDDNVKLSTLHEAMDSVAYMLFYEKCFLESKLDEGRNDFATKSVFVCDSNVGSKK